MNTMKKMLLSVLLVLSTLGLTASLPAFADGASDAAMYCTNCHDGLTVQGGVVVGNGAKLCSQRTVAEWSNTIDRMNSKGCSVPAGSIAGIANYLAGLGDISTSSTSSTSTTTTTTLSFQYCYSSTCNRCVNPTWHISSCGFLFPTPPASCSAINNWDFECSYTTQAPTTTSTSSTVTTTSTTTTTAPSTVTTVASTTTTTANYAYPCYYTDGSGVITIYSTSSQPNCPVGTTPIPKPTCMKGLPTWDGSAWVCPIDISTTTTTTLNCPAGTYYNSGGWCSTQIPTTTTTAPPTTVATTTTTTLKCNTSVNGTTQYKYSGSGTCHDKDHLVNSESWCKKHALHLESNGSHAHAYPHPVCM